jgi:hypothetical protein
MKQPLCGEDPTLGRRLARPQSRAAGVSPPWERNASAMARVFPGASTFAHHGGLTPPALGGSAVPRFADKTTTCAMHDRTFTRAAGVSPPRYGNRTDNTEHFLPNEDATMPRGAYTPRSWLHVRMSLQIRASRQRVRIFSHGWLTPAAPGGWRCGDSQNRRL